jgi:hypothetical protein
VSRPGLKQSVPYGVKTGLVAVGKPATWVLEANFLLNLPAAVML